MKNKRPKPPSKRTPPSRRRVIVIRSLSAAAGVLLAACVGEAALRIFDIRPQSLRGKKYLYPIADRSRMYHCYSSNPHGEFSPLPNTSQGSWRLTSAGMPPEELPIAELPKTPWCVEDRSSELGLRDRHYDAQPASGKVRLALVGDSFVRGEGVPLEGTLPRQLEKLLGTNQFEVVNAGAAGFDTEQEVPVVGRIYHRLGVKFALLVFIPNDIHLTAALQYRQKMINDLINIREEQFREELNRNSLYRISRLAEFIGSFFELRRITRDTVRWYLDSYNPAYNADGLNRLAENFRTLSSATNCRVGVVIYPLMFGLERDYPLAPIHARVRQMALDAGLPVLDLGPAFEGHSSDSLQVHPCDHHPNSRAHGIAAQQIYAWLTNQMRGTLHP